MDFTCKLSKAYSISPFEIMKQDKDDVIMLVNYYVTIGQENNQPSETVEDNKYLDEKDNDKKFWALL